MRNIQELSNACMRTLVSGWVALAIASCEAPMHDASVASQSAALAAGAPGDAPPMPPDSIVGPLTQDLAGLSLTYAYSEGGDYHITYGTDTVTFRLPLPNGESTPPITVPYVARKLRNKTYMVHWVNPERTVHVTQVVDLQKDEVNVSALMPGQWQLFDVGVITEKSQD
jgi:hypothetical protein